MILTANSLEFPTLAAASSPYKRGRHPNRLPFRGVLTLLDVPSDRAPAGARGHRVILPRAAAASALPTLVGMALDYTPALDGHDARRKIGVISSAEITSLSKAFVIPSETPLLLSSEGSRRATARPADSKESAGLNARGELPYLSGNRQLAAGHCLSITGYIFARDFPEVVRDLRAARAAAVTMPQLAASVTPKADDPMARSPDGPISALPRCARDVSITANAAAIAAPNITTSAVGNRPPVTGHFPLGLSYEIAEVAIENFDAPIWVVTDMTFTGAAVLRRDKAAYRNTWIEVD
jgi:hypothetical protein